MDIGDIFLAAELTGQVSREQLGKCIERAKLRAQREVEMLELIVRLRRSWRGQVDPGKGEPYWFFVRDYRVIPVRNLGEAEVEWCDAFFARELVDSLEDAESGVAEWYPSKKRVAVPLGGLDEAVREPCTECGASAFVVGWHQQVHDSPHGDTWGLALNRLCPHCCLLDRFVLQVSEYRMTHLLRRP